MPQTVSSTTATDTKTQISHGAKPANSLGKWFNRRTLLAAIGLATTSTAIAAAQTNTQSNAPTKSKPLQLRDDAVAISVAKQEIAELRCQYAKATDLIGTAQPAAVAEGRRIYHRIFRPEAVIGASGRDDVTGPDAWVDVVLDALKVYEKTQHLIGTQLVEIQHLPRSSPSLSAALNAQTGSASMSSYLQAWHAKADGELWLFIGSYSDQVVYSPKHGWQISRMMLEQISGETRQLNS